MDLLADCRARQAFDLLGNTWNPVLLLALRHGPRRPADLRRAIGGIRPKVLTETLRRLEGAGLVVRTPVPGRVEYDLAGLGRSLLGPIDALGRRVHERGDEILLPDPG
ncbi:winged helix-turn-helix transcriptional regulator [Saccharothrix sp. Mg75]|uniref:winged helix-turn-helix transcriptional regulator n=1 Tax=Saccharothrix sp. Mg75 TaxID=3445357 RepID=UPI003EE93E7D